MGNICERNDKLEIHEMNRQPLAPSMKKMMEDDKNRVNALAYKQGARPGKTIKSGSKSQAGHPMDVVISKDKDTGKGTFKWPDGSTYFGDFIDDYIQGQGLYSWADGRKYDGEWVMNKMEGYGVFKWPDGRKYEGQYLDDKKHGQGVFEWPDGRRYNGGWRNGVQDGEGTFTSAKGKIRKGIWNDGQLVKWIK